MTLVKGGNQSRASRWGWFVLLAVSAIFVLGGVSSFFLQVTLSSFEQDTGVPLNPVKEAYPTVVDYLAREGRNISILEVGLGLIALVASLEGFRRGSRWAWNALWVLAGALAALGVHALFGGSLFVGLFSLVLAAATLAGLLLARKGLPL